MPEAIRSSVRSAIVLFDFPGVVEELIFNSLDAGATKISVAVGAETCYLKVVDNGCGITRDGLVLLAERYATSKFDQLAESRAVAQSFGFRGEALSSIANISLLEILTKAHGRPNGYRKVMKGSKCLYIGIDDGRQDVGTTVIVRDLFYNQPVRRKLIHTSAKKVLESVKKCVLRISLVHPKVSFRVVDIESDDELFCATPSSSPLSRLMSGYGVEVANFLPELNVTDGVLKLSGYISSPCGISTVKAFQYIYINSRYISKGTIHKLLNQLASNFKSARHQKVNVVSQIAKRSRIQACSTFILNLHCPRSWYDITFEPSKTSVDFKDWKPIVGFIEKAVTRFWSDFLPHGDALSNGTGVLVASGNVQTAAGDIDSQGEDFSAKCRTDKRKGMVQNHAIPGALPFPYLGVQSGKHDELEYLKGSTISCHDMTNQSGSSFKSFDESPTISKVAVDQEVGSYDWAADYNVFPNEDQLVGSKFFAPEKYKRRVDYISESSFEEEHLNVGASLMKENLKIDIPHDPFEIGDVDITSKVFEMPFLKSCTSRKRQFLDEESLIRSEESHASLMSEYLKSDLPSDPFKIDNVDNMSNDFEKPFLRSCISRKRRVLDEESLMRSEGLDYPVETFRCKRMSSMLSEFNFSLRNSVESFLSGGDFHRDNDLLIDSGSVFGSKSLNFGHDLDENSWRRYESSSKYNYFAECESMKPNFHFDDIVWSASSQERCSSFRVMDTYSDFRKYACIEEDGFEFHPQYNLLDVTFPSSSDMFNDELKWLSADVHDGKYHAITSYHKLDNKDQKSVKENVRKRRPRRSHSAPPFYRGKKKLFALNNHLALEAEKCKYQSMDEPGTSREVGELRHSKISSAVCPLDSERDSMKDLLVYTRERKKGLDTCGIEKVKMKEKLESIESKCVTSVVDIQDPAIPQLKWRHGYPKAANDDKSHNPDTILDVSSGLLHLAGDLLVPESINKNFLKDVKVLYQVDKKFIPVVGNGVLAIIDQHAADERIRLEELRQKVLSGEKKMITYLDAEQDLVMPEIGYQLLHSYAEQIQNWGWLCNFHSQDPRSFKKNLNILHKQTRGITLIAVPCILGVNLTDVDLLEFLQQLADTDGSSTTPPSVHRVLNSKACRGAIMFGDTLLPSECSLIVEELKQTSLCFQCAHGRPTTVPLVNLDALHKQIDKLRSWNENSDTWHGLRRHVPSLERATKRLSSAEIQC